VGCDCLKLDGCVRSLFGMLGVRSSKIGVVRSLFGDVGMRAFKIGVVCDSEALRRNRCLGMLGERSFKIRVVSDRCLGCWGAIAKRSVGIV